MKGKGKATYYVPGGSFPVAKHETTPPQAQTTPPRGQTTAPRGQSTAPQVQITAPQGKTTAPCPFVPYGMVAQRGGLSAAPEGS